VTPLRFGPTPVHPDTTADASEPQVDRALVVDRLADDFDDIRLEALPVRSCTPVVVVVHPQDVPLCRHPAVRPGYRRRQT
jgi:hypothetical protein